MDSATAAECNLDLLKNEKHCDVVFIVGVSKERISCHQFPLMARSPVFEVMFADRWTNLQNIDNGIPSVQVPDVEPSVFRQFLHFIYGDVFTTKISEAIQILHVAHKYQVISLVQKCEQLMQTDIQLKDAIQIYQTARHFDLTSLKQKAADIMADGFFELVDDPSFTSIDEASLLSLLPRSDIPIDELELFNALLSSHPTPVRSENQRKVLEKVLPFVRFPLMKTQDFAQSVITKNILTPEESVKIFTYMNSEPETRAGLKDKLGFSWERRYKYRTGIECFYEFYDASQDNNLEEFNHSILVPHQLVSRPNHSETMEFSLAWDDNVNTVGSPQVDSIDLASVTLRGPNFASISHGNNGNLSLASSWIVSMQVKKKESTWSSSILDWACVFEEENIEIFAEQDTIVRIGPCLDLETDGQYQICVSFSGAVSLPNRHCTRTKKYLTERSVLCTDNNASIYLNGLTISNGPFNVHPLSPWIRNNSRRDHAQRQSQSEYCAHCIRSMNVIVYFPRSDEI